MDQEEFVHRIKQVENDDIKEIFGKIDVDHINLHSLGSLYYLFPLIERIIVEIFDLIPEANIEVSNQGTYKTVLEIIKDNTIFDADINSLLREYYSDNGIRNTIIHNNKNNFPISVTFEELYYLLVYLLEKYIELAEKYNAFIFKPIEEIN